jgi:hypothetical protein
MPFPPYYVNMWVDVDKLRATLGLFERPRKRWGHCAVAVGEKMYIIGGYQGNQQQA